MPIVRQQQPTYPIGRGGGNDDTATDTAPLSRVEQRTRDWPATPAGTRREISALTPRQRTPEASLPPELREAGTPQPALLEALDELIAGGTEEVAVLLADDGRRPAVIPATAAACAIALARGLRVRAAYRSAASAELPEPLASLAATGRAMVRSTGFAPPIDLVLSGRGAAVITAATGHDAGRLSVVQDAAAARTLRTTFEWVWSMSLASGRTEGIRPREEATREQIVHLLVAGAKDEVVARRLGVSLRTCRRHIAEVMRELGAISRFQAGYRAALSGWPSSTATTSRERPSGIDAHPTSTAAGANCAS